MRSKMLLGFGICLVVCAVVLPGYGYSSDRSFLSRKVGACPCFPYWQRIYGQDACFQIQEGCDAYQRFVIIAGIPAPYGCLPNASWDEGCDHEPQYEAAGYPKVEDGAMDQRGPCDGYHLVGDCSESILLICEDDPASGPESCGDKEDVRQCPAP